MNGQPTHEFEPQLVIDLVHEEPALHEFLRGDAESRVAASAFMASYFGKMWHIEGRNYAEAGIWRDAEAEALQQLTKDDATAIRGLVNGIFRKNMPHEVRVALEDMNAALRSLTP